MNKLIVASDISPGCGCAEFSLSDHCCANSELQVAGGVVATTCSSLPPIIHHELTPNDIYFVAERHEPSGISTKNTVETPEGSRPAANKTPRLGAKVDRFELTPAVVILGHPLPLMVERALNNRAIVLAILLIAGPIGLPAMWFSRRFSKPTKIVATLAYFAGTVLLPIAAVLYYLEFSLWPLVNAFPE